MQQAQCHRRRIFMRTDWSCLHGIANLWPYCLSLDYLNNNVAMMVLPKTFYAQDTVTVAQKLLSCYLVHIEDQGTGDRPDR